MTLQGIHKEIREKEPSYVYLIEAGNKLIETSQLPADKENLGEKLSDISRRWNEVNVSCEDRLEVLEKAVKATSDFQRQQADFLPWLQSTEKKVDDLRLTSDLTALEALKENIKVVLMSL